MDLSTTRKKIYMLVLLGLLCSNADAVKQKDKPQCKSQQASKCSVLAGSTDASGFLVVDVKGHTTADADSMLAEVDFHNEQETAPSCELRGSDGPKVTVRTSIYSMQIFVTEAARLPAKMRWFWVCQPAQ